MSVSSPVTVLAPAKINLLLEIFPKRPDGFHDLDSVFVAISLSDELTFSESDEIQLSAEGGDVPLDASNLVWKAGELLRQEAGITTGFHAHIKKRVPSGAGLGGGSSDAASTLLGLSKLWGLELPQNKLLELAARLGSDVPFFIRGGTMRAKGRGEVLEPLPACPKLNLVVALPDSRIPTPWAYSQWDALPFHTPVPIEPMIEALRSGEITNVAKALGNSFQEAIFPLLPDVHTLKGHLLVLGALGACMSGSGSAVFGIFSTPEQAQMVALHLKGMGFWARVAETAP